jgi:hemolysin-activating ACP:hemolysin acyltransferase
MKQLSQSQALEDGLELFRQSEAHSRYTVEDIYVYLQLPIKYHKIRLYYEFNKPVGLITWCWLYKQDADLFLQDMYHPQELDYKYDMPKSKELWGMELIAPYGHTRQMIRAIKQTTEELYGPQKVNWRRFHSRDTRRTKRFAA